MQQALFGVPRDCYPSDFQMVWERYPARVGNQSKRGAWRAYQKALKQASAQEILDGCERYRRYCEAAGIVGTPYVMMAQTFLGPDAHYEQEWALPEAVPNWQTIPKDDDELWPWAKEHGYPNPNTMNYYQYRKFLEKCVEERKARHA